MKNSVIQVQGLEKIKESLLIVPLLKAYNTNLYFKSFSERNISNIMPGYNSVFINLYSTNIHTNRRMIY